MRTVGGEAWATGIVVLEDGEERGFVANIVQARFMKVVQTGNEGSGSAH